jgi:secretion/DNA translocation related TadE-like protein
MTGSACRREHGAGSVLALSVVMMIMAMLVIAGVLAAGYSARHRAAAAADLAALAGAQRLDAGVGDPCEVAAEVAGANGGEIRDCLVDGREVEVQVRVAINSIVSWLPAQDRRARAGPSSQERFRLT